MADLSPRPNRILRAAAIQSAPIYHSLPLTLTKTLRLIAQASAQGVQLLAFPELWLPGYPLWVWGRHADTPQGDVLRERYVANSIDLSSEDGRRVVGEIGAAARDGGVSVVLGFSERNAEGSQLWIGQMLIDGRDGEVKVTRRKMRPFGVERGLFGDGGEGDLGNVVEVGFGGGGGSGRVGMLSCGENFNPLLNFSTFSQDEEVHVAGWPPVEPHPGGMAPYGMCDEAVSRISQVYAIQSQAFVLHSTGIVASTDTIAEMGTEQAPVFSVPAGGNARIFAPDGRQLTKDLPPTEEGMVVADLDLEWTKGVRQILDSREGGAMSRSDVLRLAKIGGRE